MSMVVPQGDTFDVFISYHASDKEWVTEELLNHLEEEAFSVCWDDRDFEPGKTTVENKLNALCCSTCTVVVLTANYTADEDLWSTLIGKCNAKKQEIIREFNLVPILLKECKVSDLFAPLWKLDWTNIVARKFFWTKLIQTVRRITDKQTQKDVSECKQDTTHNSFPAIVEKRHGRRSRKDRNTEWGGLEFGIDDVPNAGKKVNGDMQGNVKTLTNNCTIENEFVLQGSHKDREHIGKYGVGVVSRKNNSCNEFHMDDCGRKNSSRPALFVDSNGVGGGSDSIPVSSGKGKDVDTVFLNDTTDAKCNVNFAETPGNHGVDTPVDKCILVQQDSNDYSSDSAENELLEIIHPRIIGLFLPEDDDLTREDIEELTFKVEDVYLDDINSTDLSENKKTVNHRNHVTKKQSIKRDNFPRFRSQQEQILVLDFLQGQEVWIRKKFENCYESGRKKVYRRLLERFDKAICSTVNGKKDSELLGSLLASGLFSTENRGYNCSCCDLLFHSERALQLHMVDCVNRAWRSILAKSTQQ